MSEPDGYTEQTKTSDRVPHPLFQCLHCDKLWLNSKQLNIICPSPYCMIIGPFLIGCSLAHSHIE